MKKDAADLYALALVREAVKSQVPVQVAANNSGVLAENISAFIAALSLNLQGAIDDNVTMFDVLQMVTDQIQQPK